MYFVSSDFLFDFKTSWLAKNVNDFKSFDMPLAFRFPITGMIYLKRPE